MRAKRSEAVGCGAGEEACATGAELVLADRSAVAAAQSACCQGEGSNGAPAEAAATDCKPPPVGTSAVSEGRALEAEPLPSDDGDETPVSVSDRLAATALTPSSRGTIG